MSAPDEATILAALAAIRARWSRAPLDRCDVLERVALQLDGAPAVYLALATPPAVRLFRLIGEGRYTSCYVHELADVGRAIDLLEARAAALRERAAARSA